MDSDVHDQNGGKGYSNSAESTGLLGVCLLILIVSFLWTLYKYLCGIEFDWSRDKEDEERSSFHDRSRLHMTLRAHARAQELDLNPEPQVSLPINLNDVITIPANVALRGQDRLIVPTTNSRGRSTSPGSSMNESVQNILEENGERGEWTERSDQLLHENLILHLPNCMNNLVQALRNRDLNDSPPPYKNFEPPPYSQINAKK